MSAVFLVQSFARARKGGIMADAPIQVFTIDEAIRLADRLLLEKSFVLAVQGDEDGQTLIHAAGEVPDDVADMPGYRLAV